MRGVVVVCGRRGAGCLGGGVDVCMARRGRPTARSVGCTKGGRTDRSEPTAAAHTSDECDKDRRCSHEIQRNPTTERIKYAPYT